VAFTVFVVCFLFVGGMLLASGNGGGHDDDATSNSASAATLPEEDVGDDVGGSNDGGVMTTTSSTGLRSSGAPSPEPITAALEDITMAIIPTNEPTKMAADKPTEDVSSALYPCFYLQCNRFTYNMMKYLYSVRALR